MTKKRAVIGFKGVALAPVKTNDVLAYETTEAFALPFAGAMNRTPKEKKQDINYDDALYAQVNDVQGEDVEVRIGEVQLQLLDKLGLGKYDAQKHTFEGDFVPKPGAYSLRCIEDTVDRLPYYFNWRVFELTSIRFDNFATKGDSVKVCEVIIIGIFKAPNLPTLKPYAIMEMADDESNKEACEAFMKDGEKYPAA